MNYPENHTALLELADFQIKEALRILLNTVLFNRLIEQSTVPIDMVSDVFDIGYLAIDDQTVRNYIETSIDQVYQKLIQNQHGVIQLEFYTIKSERSFMSMFYTEKKKTWEIWTFPIAVIARYEEKNVEEVLNAQVFEVLRMIDEKKDHIPDMSKSKYDIGFLSGNDGSVAWLPMLTQAPSKLFE